MTGVRAIVWGGIAGAFLGAPHLAPAAHSLALVGLGALLRLRECGSRAARVGAWFAAAFVAHAVALIWFPGAARVVLDANWMEAFAFATAGWLLGGFCTALPGALVIVLGRDRALPIAWIVGEALCEAVTDFPGAHLLYGQWKSPWVLALLPQIGWWGTQFVFVGLAMLLARVRNLALWIAAASASALPLSAAPPRVDPTVVPSVAWPELPQTWPVEAQLIVWPEVALRAPVSLAEGTAPIRLDLAPAGMAHIIGARLLTSRGEMNGALVVDENGYVLTAYGKRRLAPLGERTLFGVGRSVFVPGDMSPVVEVSGLRVRIVICMEAYTRAEDEAVDVIAALASDRPLGGSALAERQQLGALALRAAELGVPVVRAAKGGPSAYIDAKGRITVVGLAGPAAR